MGKRLYLRLEVADFKEEQNCFSKEGVCSGVSYSSYLLVNRWSSCFYLCHSCNSVINLFFLLFIFNQ